ncbi:MAG TPA: hypothetical protein VL294_10295 [Pseudolysinimonas sp.]|nr:hypothetical protein [Pseudolysinimonas sp.]
MDGSTPRRIFSLASGVLLVAALTAVVFLIRAGGDPSDAATWPITWELRSSDNGVLFQVLQDVVVGRPLHWSFSPQVFVFPELPISAVAFVLAGGSVYGYYLCVAVLNTSVLFLVLVALVRVLYPGRPALLRALVATGPLILLPLVGTTWIVSFALAPTYYFGMYAALLLAPVLVLARSRAGRIATGAALALTAASNPLALVFAAPGTAGALLLLVIRRGRRAALRPVVLAGSTLLAAAVLRLVVTPLQGTSPLTYVDPAVFATRLSQLQPYYAFQARDPAAAVILATGAALALAALGGAVVAAVQYVRRGGRAAPRPDARLLAVVYLGLVPLGGIAATFALMITHYLYFWPVLILPYVLALLAVPRVAVPASAVAAAGAVVIVAIGTGGAANLGEAGRFFGYRTAETRCLDAVVPGQTGYATFSDARRLSLPSATGVHLIQLEATGEPSTWLTNRAYATSEPGTFFYVNDRGDERPIDTGWVVGSFGAPDREATCSDGQSVLIYSDPAKRERIAAHFGVSEG